MPAKRFRIRVIPATLLFIYGFLFAAGGLFMLGLRVWDMATGESEPRGGDVPTVWTSMALLSLSVSGFIAGLYWMRGRWKGAIVATLITFALHAIQGTLGSIW